jgi:hypothetical protein
LSRRASDHLPVKAVLDAQKLYGHAQTCGTGRESELISRV